MARNTFAVTSLDNLFMALGGFAEPEPSPREVWRERLTKLWPSRLSTAEIAHCLGTTANNIRQHAYLMRLPPRRHGVSA